MEYKTLDELNELIEKELRKMVDKGTLSPSELEAAEKAVCLMEKIIRLEGGSYDDMEKGASYGRSYDRMRSPRTGRYMSRDGNYYDRGYSGHSIGDRAISRLESMMDEAGSEYEREEIKKFIRAIRSEEM